MSLKEIVNLLLKNKKTIAIAESCTGGLISSALTRLSGSSKFFKLGLVVYSNQAKSRLLNIYPRDISRFGAVSRRIALLMAKGVKKLAKTDIGISTTGIAGPAGGSKKKPVGTVFIALAYKNSVWVEKFKFIGTRTQIRIKTKNKALSLIKRCLKNP